MVKLLINVQGMHCQACVNRLEKQLNQQPFIQQATVNFANEQAIVLFNSERHSVQDVLHIIQQAGFRAELIQSDMPLVSPKPSLFPLLLLLLLCIPFVVMMLAMLTQQHHFMLPVGWQFILATIVQFGLATPFYRSAWQSIKAGLANMDVLVSIGTLTIYFYSVFLAFFAENSTSAVYFESSVMVIAFVRLGKYLEQRTKSQSLNTLHLLMQLTPQQVRLYRNQNWENVPLQQVQKNDLLWAKQGERIAADGMIEQGEAWLDESHLTGEFNPQTKGIGEVVLAGSIVKTGNVVYRAEQLGSQTHLADMLQALAEAQGSKAPIARLADKVAAMFVPAVIMLALLTFAITFWLSQSSLNAFINAVSVLVIACPCALGLATPAAIMVGMGKAVQQGIRFKDAATMENTAKIDTLVFDKTGTLTEGKPHITAVWLAEKCGYTEQAFYQLAASVTQYSNHPLAQAITQTAQQKAILLYQALNIHTDVGAGLKATLPSIGEVKVGSMVYCGFQLPDDVAPVWQVASIVAVAVNNRVVGAFALTDQLKSHSLVEIQRLQNMGLELYIMSGDRQSAVEYIAQQLNIQQAYAELSPRQKAEKIQQLTAAGKKVAMIGDGINDAPALAAAQVGFAIQSGTDLAQHTARVSLMGNSIHRLTYALLIAKATLTNIKQNLFLAFIYNVLAIPLAALGYLNPMIAAAAMVMSSLSVLFNALRLKAKKLDG